MAKINMGEFSILMDSEEMNDALSDFLSNMISFNEEFIVSDITRDPLTGNFNIFATHKSD